MKNGVFDNLSISKIGGQTDNLLQDSMYRISILLVHMGRGDLYTDEQKIDNTLALRKYPNLYMDLSTVDDLKSIINVCEIIEYDRVIYAADYPFGKNYLGEKYDYSDEFNKLKRHLSGNNGEYIFYKNIADCRRPFQIRGCEKKSVKIKLQ